MLYIGKNPLVLYSQSSTCFGPFGQLTGSLFIFGVLLEQKCTQLILIYK